MRDIASEGYDPQLMEKANTNIARFLRERATDPRKLADYLGCSVQAISQYKCGVVFPKVENLIKIAKYYGVSLDYLVDNSCDNAVSMLVSLGFSCKAAEELAALSNQKNGARSKSRFAALNRLIENSDYLDGLLSGLELCTRFGKTLTYHEADLLNTEEKQEGVSDDYS